MRRFDLKIIVFFVVLTVLLTIGVIAFWEATLRPPFFAWVDARYPGDANVQRRWDIKQRVEHVVISFMVDALVVTMLLRLVHRQQRQLRASEERYRALFEQARDGIGVVRLSDHHLVEANNKACEILGVGQQECIDRDIRELLRAPQPQLMSMTDGHTSGESELTIQTAEGKPRPISVSFTPLSTDGEEVMIMSLRDLSLRKKLEAEREEMQRQLQRQQEQAQKLAERLRATGQVKVLAKPAPPSTRADRARVLATVNDKQITTDDIEDSLRPLIFNVQEQVYALRKQDLELKINDALLAQEAQKKGLTTRALLDQEVSAKVPTVTDAQAQAFYDENKERISGEFAQLKSQIVQYIRERKEQEATLAFAEQLRRASKIEINLTAPESPAFSIATDDQPVKGNPKASVTIVEFTDFECPSCARQHPVLDRIVSEFGDRVRLVVRDFPLSQHANARKAAEAAEAAREQGKYWEYAAVLFRNQSALGIDKLRQYATEVGLDRTRFDASLDSGKFAEKVQRDMMEGRKLGINGTPTLYINGKRVSDNSYESLKSAIEQLLKAEAALKPVSGK